jgi:hypothetical protein
MKKIILPVLFSVFLLTACSSSEAQHSGLISAETELFYSFGDVDIAGGLVSHNFGFVNDGEEPLQISNLSTSCMCTEAEVVLSDGEKSPVFGMHDKTEWNHFVEPGEKFEVLVTYDPMAHGPDAVGEINRSVTMFTSSEENGRVAVFDETSDLTFTQMNIHGLVYK